MFRGKGEPISPEEVGGNVYSCINQLLSDTRNHPFHYALAHTGVLSEGKAQFACLAARQRASTKKRSVDPAGRLFPPFAQALTVFLLPSSATFSL
jgi:hypothetical protein